ncbi:MAG: hypothetical protein GY906_24585 [bacterium]|nr:hypothetical protein [bacterium]
MSLKEELTRQIIEQGAKRKLQRSLRFTDDDIGYRIRFMHRHPMPPGGEKLPTGEYPIGDTHCYIEQWLFNEWRVYSWGQARCSPSDRFIKETGRRVALKRALAEQEPHFRTSAWTSYLGRKD